MIVGDVYNNQEIHCYLGPACTPNTSTSSKMQERSAHHLQAEVADNRAIGCPAQQWISIQPTEDRFGFKCNGPRYGVCRQQTVQRRRTHGNHRMIDAVKTITASTADRASRSTSHQG